MPALLATLLPKCPLCVAGYLALLGVGAGVAATAAPLLYPLALLLTGLALVTIIVSRTLRG